MGKRIDLAGRRFGRLEVQSLDSIRAVSNGKAAFWRCRCDCGAAVVVHGYHLRAGMTRSCGCLKQERARESNTTHGKTGTPEYNAWAAARSRCTCPTNEDYPRYGARGITVDPRWSTFEQFIADMGPRPSPQHSIDRIDNDGPYSPENCQWATREAQLRNRRTTRMITFDGRTQCLSDWAAELGVRVSTLHARLNRMPVDRALTLHQPPA